MSQFIEKEKAVSDIAKDIVFTIITCGIYNFFWQARQFKVLNGLLGKDVYSFKKWLLFTLISCGIYHVYNQYLIGCSLQDIQKKLGKPYRENLPIICLLLSIFGLSIAADAIQQHEINSFYNAD